MERFSELCYPIFEQATDDYRAKSHGGSHGNINIAG